MGTSTIEVAGMGPDSFALPSIAVPIAIDGRGGTEGSITVHQSTGTGRLLRVSASTSTSLHVLNLVAAGFNGAIEVKPSGPTVSSAFYLDGVSIAGGEAAGGGVAIEGGRDGSTKTWVITNSTFATNTVSTDAEGGSGAIYLGGYGGETYHMYFGRDRFASNSACSGGAIDFNSMAGTVVIDETEFQGNRADNTGACTTRHGGAIQIEGSNSAVFRVQRSTFTGNSATDRGGAIAYDGSGGFTLQNSTFAGNTTMRQGAAISDEAGTMTVLNSTFAGDVAPEYLIYIATGTVAVGSSVVAGPPSTDLLPPSGSGGISLGHNVVTSTWDAATDTDQIAVSTASIVLGPLASNGGFTPTMAIGPGSIAAGTGDCSLSPATTIDQRGWPRKPACDAGAFEQ
jgi:predicted outer membrane repeat protein